MSGVLRQDEKYLRDAFGSAHNDGACVLDADRQAGDCNLAFSTGRGPDSAHCDGWFSVSRAREGRPLRGKVENGRLVQLIGSST
jgi:hypothetical protein